MSANNPDLYEYDSSDETPGRKRFAPKPSPARLRRQESSAPGRPGFTPLILLFLCLALTAAVSVPLGLGVMNGLRDRDELIRVNAEEHFQRALNYEAEDYLDLAIAELQLALRYNPNYAPARQKLIELQSQSASNSAQGPVNVAAQLFKQASASAQQQAWDDAIGELEEVRRVDPNYEKEQVENLLFQAYTAGGKLAVAVGNIELARQRFDSALQLQPNDAYAKQQRDLARSYLTAQQALGYDWGIAVTNFQKVYQQDPNYFDIKRQYVNALLGSGDQAAARGAWCVAAREYERANQISPSPPLAANLAQANVNCRTAVLNPTPTPMPTPLAGATPSPSPLPGDIVIGEELFGAQKIVETNVKCSGTGAITGYVRDSANLPLAGILLKYDNLQGATASKKTDAGGFYEFTLGKDPGVFYVAVLTPDGRATQSQVIEINYAGGNAPGCRIILNWTRHR